MGMLRETFLLSYSRPSLAANFIQTIWKTRSMFQGYVSGYVSLKANTPPRS